MGLARRILVLCFVVGCGGEPEPTPTPLPMCEANYHSCEEDYILPEFGEAHPISSAAGPAVDTFATIVGSTLPVIAVAPGTLEDGCQEWIPEWPNDGCPDETWIQNRAWLPLNFYETQTPFEVWAESMPVPPNETVGRELFFDGQEAVGLIAVRGQGTSAMWCVNDDFFATALVYGDPELIMGCEFPPLPEPEQ